MRISRQLLYGLILIMIVIALVTASSIHMALRLLILRRCRTPPKLFIVDHPLPLRSSIDEVLHIIMKRKYGRMSFKIQEEDIPNNVLQHYMNDDVLRKVQELTGKRVVFAPKKDPDRIFIKLYHRHNDRIHWHYDPNFTKGKRYTLIFLLSRDSCSTAHLQFKDCVTGEVNDLPEKDGVGVVFDASQVFHRVTSQHEGCRRLTVIIPLYEDPRFYLGGRIHSSLQKLGNKLARI